MKNLCIKRISKREIPELIRLIRKVILNIKYYPKRVLKKFLEVYTPEYLSRLSKQKDAAVIIAIEDGKIVGFAFGWNDYGVYWLDWVGVAKEHRQQGVGTKLLQKFESECRKKGGHKIHLDTSRTNKPAICFYRKNGYSIEGHLNKHWLKWDYILLSKILGKN